VIRVVVADDQDLIRGGLCAILGSEPDIDVIARRTVVR
jgi:two-component system, NarL family, response regulator DesR